MPIRPLAPAAALATCMLLLAGCQSGTSSLASFPGAPLSAADRDIIDVRAALDRPQGNGPFPAVVLLHSCGGVREHLHDWSRFLVERGYAALVVDTFASRRLGPCPNGRDPNMMAGLEMVSDAYGALAYLAARPDIAADRVYVMGFSLGGWAVRAMATRDPPAGAQGRFRGAIALYAGCMEYAGRERLTFPTLVIIGTNDGRDFPSCDLAAQTRSNRDLDVRIIPGAYHAFDQNPGPQVRQDMGGRPMRYDAGAVRLAKTLVEGFLAAR